MWNLKIGKHARHDDDWKPDWLSYLCCGLWCNILDRTCLFTQNSCTVHLWAAPEAAELNVNAPQTGWPVAVIWQRTGLISPCKLCPCLQQTELVLQQMALQHVCAQKESALQTKFKKKKTGIEKNSNRLASSKVLNIGIHSCGNKILKHCKHWTGNKIFYIPFFTFAEGWRCSFC